MAHVKRRPQVGAVEQGSGRGRDLHAHRVLRNTAFEGVLLTMAPPRACRDFRFVPQVLRLVSGLLTILLDMWVALCEWMQEQM